MEGNPLRPLPGEGEAEDEKSRRKKEREEREAHERVVKKPENLGFLAVESEPEEPSLLKRAWEGTKPGPEDGQEDPVGPEEDEDPARAEVPPIVPPPESMRPAPEDDEEPVPPPMEAAAPPAEDVIEQDRDTVDEDEPPAPMEIPAEPARVVPEVEPDAAQVEAGEDDDEDLGLEPETPAAPDPEAGPGPEPEAEAAPEPELPRAAEETVTPKPEEEMDRGGENAADEEELRIDHGRQAEAPSDAENGVEEEAAGNREAADELTSEPEAATEAASVPQAAEEAPAPDAEEASVPDAEEPHATPEAPEAERPQPDPAEARPFEFVEGAHDEEEPSIAAEQAAEEEPGSEEQKAPEHIGHMLMNDEAEPGPGGEHRPLPAEATVVPETSRSSMAAESRMNVESAPRGPLAGIRVETLNRTELMDIARSIDIDGNNLLQIYDTHLIGERGLRRLIIEYQKGGDLGEALKREVMEREMDFERDPAMRSLAPSSVSPSDDKGVDADNHPLQKLLKEANADADSIGNGEEKAAFLEARTNYEAKRGSSRERYRVMADAGFFLVIVILFLLVVIVYLRR